MTEADKKQWQLYATCTQAQSTDDGGHVGLVGEGLAFRLNVGDINPSAARGERDHGPVSTAVECSTSSGAPHAVSDASNAVDLPSTTDITTPASCSRRTMVVPHSSPDCQIPSRSSSVIIHDDRTS